VNSGNIGLGVIGKKGEGKRGKVIYNFKREYIKK